MLIFYYSYLIENDVCYLVLCERHYSKRTAYSYLEDIAQEFHNQYGKRVNTVTRPYTFIEFGMLFVILMRLLFFVNINFMLYYFFCRYILAKSKENFF